MPVLPLKRFITSLMTANDTETPNITNANVPTAVKCPAVSPTCGTQTKVSNPFKNSSANFWINPKPLWIASITAAPILYLFCKIFFAICEIFSHLYIYIVLYIYIKFANKKT